MAVIFRWFSFGGLAQLVRFDGETRNISIKNHRIKINERDKKKERENNSPQSSVPNFPVCLKAQYVLAEIGRQNPMQKKSSTDKIRTYDWTENVMRQLLFSWINEAKLRFTDCN